MSLGLKPDHLRDVISVVAEFMVDVARVEARPYVRPKYHTSLVAAFLLVLLYFCRHDAGGLRPQCCLLTTAGRPRLCQPTCLRCADWVLAVHPLLRVVVMVTYGVLLVGMLAARAARRGVLAQRVVPGAVLIRGVLSEMLLKESTCLILLAGVGVAAC
jgi:hypothetical protein